MEDVKKRYILGTTFIAVSALVYFLFMCAWLNVFLFLGLALWVRTIIGVIALAKVSPDMIVNNIPAGWMNPFFGLHHGLDWKGILDSANTALQKDGNELFGIIFGLMFFKGILASLAGPNPTYDMQRILATKSPREACLMNGSVTMVLMFPRYMMIAGITVLALAFCMPAMRGMETALALRSKTMPSRANMPGFNSAFLVIGTPAWPVRS